MINQKEFTNLMNKLNGVFPGISNAARLSRYYDALNDLPPEALSDIADIFMDSFKQMPLPADFKNAATSWKKNFYSKYGYWPNKKQTVVVEYIKIECDICDDLGIVFIEHHEPDSFKTLMRCTCKAGDDEGLRTPQWDSQLARIYKRKKIPSDWFKPMIDEKNSDEKIFIGIMEKLQRWQNFKKKSQDYWHSIGYK